MKEDNMKQGWEIIPFEDSIVKVKYTTKIPSNDYLEQGLYPIVSQEEGLISGYWNSEDEVFKISSPVVIFGDHTRILKYVDFDFVLGADGVKILQPIERINAKFFKLYIESCKIPSLGYSRHYKLLKELQVPVPPLPVQEQIVSELDLLSGIIEKKREQLKELDALAQSIFYDMFGDPITNEKGWEVKKLGEVCNDITDGDHMPPPKSEIGIPFLTISNIDKEKRELNFNDTFFVTEEYYDNIKENRKAKRGDVLYTVTGSYGIPVIVNTDKHFCFQRHIALLKPTQETLLPIFLCHWFLCDGVKFIADQVATGIAQKTVSLTSIRKFEIILPPLPLQHQFASKIEAIESQKELIKQSISETETLFNARMQHYFS